MNTHRQRSFIAAVSSESGTLGYFRQLHPKILIHPFANRGRFGFNFPTAEHLLSHVGIGRKLEPLLWYFRSTDTGYAIFIRSKLYFGRFIGYRDHTFGALSTELEGRSKYRFEPVEGQEDEGVEEFSEGDEIITKIISKDTGKPLCLQTEYFKRYVSGGWTSKVCTYIAADGGQPLNFRLKILQVNAPYLNDPDEM